MLAQVVKLAHLAEILFPLSKLPSCLSGLWSGWKGQSGIKKWPPLSLLSRDSWMILSRYRLQGYLPIWLQTQGVNCRMNFLKESYANNFSSPVRRDGTSHTNTWWKLFRLGDPARLNGPVRIHPNIISVK